MKPKVQAILLADHVYKDEFTGKYIVSGIHDTYFFNPNPPALKSEQGDLPLDMQRAGAPYVYVNLTEFNGRFNFQLRYYSLKADEVIAAFSFQQKTHPLYSHELLSPPITILGNYYSHKLLSQRIAICLTT